MTSKTPARVGVSARAGKNAPYFLPYQLAWLASDKPLRLFARRR